jgi:hypothetical protein
MKTIGKWMRRWVAVAVLSGLGLVRADAAAC